MYIVNLTIRIPPKESSLLSTFTTLFIGNKYNSHWLADSQASIQSLYTSTGSERSDWTIKENWQQPGIINHK